MQLDSIGIVGYGHFGQFVQLLIQRFLPEVDIKVFSRRHDRDGAVFFSLEEVATCDVVILCGSISEYEEQLQSVVAHMRPDTILVDVATVKKYPTSIFQKYAADKLWVSCHPMFGPESYKKSNGEVVGFRIVITDYTLVNNTYLLMKAFLARLGFVVIEMTADEHDRLLAETLFITHYIGQTMAAGKFTRTTLDSVSFSSLMNAVESVAQDEKLFHDVYLYNPYCKAAAARFHAAQEEVFKKLPQ